MSDLSVEFLGKRLPSPIVLASGIWGTTVSLLERAAIAGCGAVTAKSCGPTPRTGHVNPTCLDWGHGLINAIGLANPGAEAEAPLLAQAKDALAAHGVALIASVFAGRAHEFGEVAAVVAAARPDYIEVNISCPNVASEYGIPFSGDAASAAAATRAVVDAVSAQGIPVIVKLAPNVTDIATIARAVVDAGAGALCAVNTMPGIVIDAASGQSVLANRTGGISGPALKPIALKCVYDLHRSLPHVPIIGTGGVSTGVDAVEMLMAGATVVGVGSAVYYRGAEALTCIRNELGAWMLAHGMSNPAQMRGLAHREMIYASTPTVAPVPVAH
jgi:dihydroorotate dehydrogenase (NAD+) catalytic subunit